MSMALLIGWLLSVVTLLAGIAMFFMRVTTEPAERVWRPLCIATFFAILVVQLAEQFVIWPDGGSPILTSVFNTVQTFILERDAPSMTDEIAGLLGGLAKPYIAYGVLLSLVAPIATAGSAVLVFSHFVSLPLLWLRSARRETYVFSELNESSLALATSVKQHFDGLTPPVRCTIAFARSAACEDEDLLNEARVQGMLFSKLPIDRLMVWCRGREHCHMVLSERSSSANVTEGLRLTELIPQAKRPLASSVHVFADVNQTEGFADIMAWRAAQKGGCKVRRIDATITAVRRALVAYPLFLAGDPARCSLEELYERPDRRILIIGANDVATEFLKAAIWCGRAYGMHMTVDVVDEDVTQLRERLAFACPEIMSNRGEQGYDVRFHECSCSSKAFLELMRDIGGEVTYTLVSGADDLTTASVARRVRGLLQACRMRCGATGASPLVLAAVWNSNIAAALEQSRTSQGQPYDIWVMTCGDDLLTYENVFMPHAERWATNLNRALWGCYDVAQTEPPALQERADAAFETSELDRFLAMASVIFSKHLLFSLCRRAWAHEAAVDIDRTKLPTASAWMSTIDDAALETVWDAYGQCVGSGTPTWVSRLDHERWMAYVRTLGYERATGPVLDTLMSEGTTQSQLARLHACLMGFDELPSTRETLDGTSDEHPLESFVVANDAVLRHLPQIIRDTE